MEYRQNINLKSEEVQELLGTTPSWVILWGTIFIIFTILSLAMVGWVVKYPDVVQAPATLTSEMPPLPVVARADGYLSDVFVRNDQKVKKGDSLGVISNPAFYQDVFKLCRKLEDFSAYNTSTFHHFEEIESLVLGEIQEPFTTFAMNIRQYQIQSSGQTEKLSIIQMQSRIRSLENALEVDRKRLQSVQFTYGLRKKAYAQSQTDYAHYKIDLKQLEEYRADLSNVETQIKNIEAEIEAKKIEISSLKGQINFIQQGAKIGSSQTLDRINESEKNLRAAVENWKQNFLLIAPVDGAVSFFEKDGKQKQFVKKGDEILVVVPEGGERKMVAKVALPVKENGKVKPNQRVLIRLSSFPYQEYGKLEGKVQYVAEVPKDGFISLEVSLPEGLKTNKNKTINFEQQLMGTAEIITEEKRFMVRVVESIF